jgi:Cd2+/Zn2+-exporting ATPase
MLVAAVAAVVLGEWSEAAAVVFLFAVAQALEARTLERARLAVRALLDLAPTHVLLRDGAAERREPVERIEPGAVIVVRPGEKIPLDGVVVTGASTVNQAPVTGESMPADKAAGDEVYAGTINGRGALEVRVTRRHRDTTLSRIIYLVERAQASRAPVQTFVERFARVYTPAVLALSVAIAIVPPLAGGDARTWIYRALVLLVVSCPCALVISTPVSVVAALAGAARRGVLIKGGTHLERASRVRCVAFDKTGTLTRGTPEVVAVTALDGGSADRVLSLAASLERRSEHPIAQAIVRHGRERAADESIAADVRSLPGRGVEGRANGAPVLIGNLALFEERGLDTPGLRRRVEALGASGQTAVLVAEGGTVAGVIAVSDRPREAARGTVELLRHQGVTSIVMLTGDSEAAAYTVAAELGVDEVRAGLLPEDKVAAIEDLRRRYGTVAMVGDGINDAPALATADLGIAMGVVGTDAALEAADIALMADELQKIPYALRVSRTALRNIKTNLAVSLALKAGFVVAAVAGAATLWMAVVADTGASLIVIANALRLLRAD